MTTTTVLTPVGQTPSTTLADFGVAVPSSHYQNRSVRASNIGTADAYIDLLMTDGSTVVYLCKNFLIEYNTQGGAVDLVTGHFLPAGWKYRARASAVSAIDLSMTGLDRG